MQAVICRVSLAVGHEFIMKYPKLVSSRRSDVCSPTALISCNDQKLAEAGGEQQVHLCLQRLMSVQPCSDVFSCTEVLEHAMEK